MDTIQAIEERIRYLYEELFYKNQLEMARAVEISQTTISKVINGHRKPGRKFLTALAAHAKVNPEWLYSGTGDPFREPLKKYLDRLPIFRTIPALDCDSREEFLIANRPVMHGQYTKGCYFLETHTEMPLVHSSGLSIVRGDLMLMKPLKDFPLKANALDERIAVVKLLNPKTQETELMIGQLDWFDDEEGSYFEFDIWKRKKSARSANTIAVTIEIQGQKIVGTKCHALPQDPTDSRTNRRALLTPQNKRIKKQDIVAYCEQLIRVFY